MKLLLCLLVLAAGRREMEEVDGGDGGRCQDWTPTSCLPPSAEETISRAARKAGGCPNQLCDINYCTFMPWRKVLPDNPVCCCHPIWSCRPRCQTILGTG